MWFTRVSLQNPVFATMVMLALVVLGIFSYQRLKVDQFPNIDFPVVVITTEYPGASPEIVESEVSKKIEEGVNSIAGISALTSRSYENQSVVVMEFQLQIDGRKAAEDVREKVASLRPLLRTEIKEPRVLRFDPSSLAVWSLAVIPQGNQLNAVELTNWSEQVLKKRLENVRGVGSVSLVGGSKREIILYLQPANMEALGVTAEQVVSAVRNENQDLPVGAIRSLQQERMVQISSRMERPEDFGRIIVARKNGTPIRLSQVAKVQDGAQELENLALYNGQRTLLMSVQKSQDENTIQVVDGLVKAVAELQGQLPPGVKLDPITDNSRPIRVSVNNVRQTLIEGAILTVLIVFLFLNSWRSTVITGLTLPISFDRYFHVHADVRLHHQHDHADGAEFVRGPLDRRRDCGAREHRAPCANGQKRLPCLARRHARDWLGRVGHHLVHRGGVFADRLHGRDHRQVLPRVRHHHRGGRHDLDVCELHTRPHAFKHLARSCHRCTGSTPSTRELVRQDHWPRDRLV